jgi:hypothetical protein
LVEIDELLLADQTVSTLIGLLNESSRVGLLTDPVLIPVAALSPVLPEHSHQIFLVEVPVMINVVLFEQLP